MANKELTGLTEGSSIGASDIFLTRQGADTEDKRVTGTQIGSFIAGATLTLTNKTFDANGTGNSLSNVETADIASGSKSGSDATLVTGTAGSNGNIVQWNSDGDAVDASVAVNNLALLSGANAYTNTNTYNSNIVIGAKTLFQKKAELTIATGEITIVGTYHSVDTASDAASDDLDTINGGFSGAVLYLQTANDARDVVLKHGTGNIVTASGSDVTLTNTSKIAHLIYDGDNWVLVAVYEEDVKPTESFIIACSDEATDLTTGTAKVTFRMPYSFIVTDVRANVNTAPTGSTIIVDINDGGTTIMSTNKISIDAGEKTSETAATQPTVTDSSLNDDAEITIDIDQIGSSTAGKGLKVTIIGYRA